MQGPCQRTKEIEAKKSITKKLADFHNQFRRDRRATLRWGRGVGGGGGGRHISDSILGGGV